MPRDCNYCWIYSLFAKKEFCPTCEEQLLDWQIHVLLKNVEDDLGRKEDDFYERPFRK